MASSKSPPGSVRRTGRNISHPIVRRSTKGPLDLAEDPLSSITNETAAVISEEAQSTGTAQAPAPKVPNTIDASITRTLPPQLRFLQDPRLYHQISNDDIPRGFLESPQQHSANTHLKDLLQDGHFRQAAESALHELLNTTSDDASSVLRLLYRRLACLALIGRPDLAADEALPLLDFISSNAPGLSEVLALVPWPLRTLLIRSQSVAAQDGGRRAIMALYALAGEVRATIRQSKYAGDHDAVMVWSTRLSDIGLQVSDTLVEMGELDTASRHLDSLVDIDQDEVLIRKVLMRSKIGDITAARKYAKAIADPHRRAVHEALLLNADPDVNHALSSWHSLAQRADDNGLAAQNEAVYLLYCGRIEEALQMLKSLVEKGAAFHTLLFNFNTIQELCTGKGMG